jgi:hypothetical protein
LLSLQSHELMLRFEGRILGVDENVADAWGKIMARREAAAESALWTPSSQRLLKSTA